MVVDFAAISLFLLLLEEVECPILRAYFISTHVPVVLLMVGDKLRRGRRDTAHV